MATMERPKVQKKKKTKKPAIEENLLTESEKEDEETPTTSKKALDVHSMDSFLPTTKSDDIVSHECFVSANYQPFDKISLDDEDLISDNEEKTTDDKEKEEEKEKPQSPEVEQHDEEAKLEEVEKHEDIQSAAPAQENLPVDIPCAPSIESDNVSGTPKPWTQNFEEPTAPVLLESKTATQFGFQPAAAVKYPNLESLNRVEAKTEVFYQTYKPSTTAGSMSRLKPFTTEQLREIYYCHDIELVKQFELEFLMNSLLENTENDPFYVLLQEYFNLQGKLMMNLSDIAERKERFDAAKSEVWSQIQKTAKGTAMCGDNKALYHTKNYKVAVISQSHLALAMNALNQSHQLLCQSFIVNLVSSKLVKIKIDKIIDEIMSYQAVRHISNNSPISLNINLDPESLHCVNRLRRAITILFSFIRRPSPNKTFKNNVHIWLQKLISLHIRVGTREDHWFLLFHVLRCPNGIGNWAKEFIQLPLTDTPKNQLITLSSPEINHCVAVLHILLLPIKKRNDFLKAFSQSHKEISDPVKSDTWILIESDGEEGTTSNGECIGLKESDLIALLDQMPFEMLFCHALNVEKTKNSYVLEADLITGNQVLKVIAFCSTLVDIFGDGLLTYNKERYKQLAKRLGRLVRHILQYVSDYHELFIRNNLSKDPYLCERINVELNAILIKACSYIYRTRNLATWQYFSSLPYNSLDASTVWQLFFYLNVGFPTQFPAPHEDYIARFHATDFWNYFNGANADSSPEDMYYLLQAFFEMANERDKKDWELVQAICLHIFDIGFINEKTRDICYKASRDMLVNLTLAYNDLMSSLLLQLKIRFEEVENAAYLFKSLPLENWKPGIDSFEIISSWLLHFDYKTKENTIARIIVSHLNWGFDFDGRLYLQHNIHVRMACLVTEALTKHAPEVLGQSGISESVRQTSNLESQSTKEQFTTWCWSMISILRLHLMDQSIDSIRNTLQNPTEPLLFIPDLERIEVIYQGVTESRPLSMYVAILVSLWGHSVPLICQKGFEQMKLLLNDYRHAAVTRCIELILPFFMETPGTLAKCESFQAILVQLLNADKTYLKMAKEMLFSSSIGPVLELLDNMIQHQIISYYNYGLQSPLMLVTTWLEVLTNVPNWQNTMVVYLIDKILTVAYQFPDVWNSSKEYFRVYYKDCDEWKSHKISTLKMILGASTVARVPNLTVTNYGWFALLLLEIEFDLQDSKIWPEFLRQVSAAPNDSKINLDAILKKTSSIVKCPNFLAQNLVIYKYANLISTIEFKHPTFPLLVQQFFILFLARVPLHPDEERFQYTYGVSDKFYEYNVTLMKKIKSNLKSAEMFYSEKCGDDGDLAYFYSSCGKMMKTYSLWLEETTINKISKDQLNFPPQFNPDKLQEILSGSKQHWTELVFLPKLRKAQGQQSEQWCKKCLRSKSPKLLRNALQPKPRTTPLDRIKTHLKSYDKRLEGPSLIPSKVVTPVKRVAKETLTELRKDLKVLDSAAKKFNLTTCEHNILIQHFEELIQKLYVNLQATETESVACSFLLNSFECKRPARVVVEYHIPTVQVDIQRKLEANGERFKVLHNEIFNQDVDQLTLSIDRIESIIKLMVSSQVESGVVRQYSKDVTEVGIQFFYDIVKSMNEVMMKYPPCTDLCNNFLTELGIFIQDNHETEGLRILELALKRPDLLKIISNIFVPYRTGPKYFIYMYKFLIDSHLKRCDKNILFVLLSKFDFPGWLQQFRPKLVDINKLVKLIIFGLESWNQSDAKILQDIFRRHLLYIFEHEFPEHYGEVVQLVLDSASDQKLMPEVLLDLLNWLLKQFNCDILALDSTDEKVQSVSAEFARRQNLFNLKGATDTVKLFATHFQKERLHNGLHGLYPKHKEYCKPLAMWFSCFSHVIVTTAIVDYPGLLADQIGDCIFASLIEMYAPWLIAYTEQQVQQSSPEWIQQLIAKEKVLYPWSAVHVKTSQTIITPFINSILFVLESLPVSQSILGHTYSFYIHHYAVEKMELHVRKPIHEGIVKLPWELFKPLPNHINILFESLKVFAPESHALLGHIFLRIDWNTWVREVFSSWPIAVQTPIASRLLTIFVKISFEPNIHCHTNTSRILEDAIVYPWYLVEYQDLENLFKWVLETVEPSILLRLPSESNYTDRAALDLLKVSSAMMPEKAAAGPITHATAKRILYARSNVRLLRMCAAKYNKLVASKDGFRAFSAALKELMDLMERTVSSVCTTKEERDQEALNLMIEIIVSMQSQSEETSKFFIEILVDWQSKCKPGSALLCQTLNAFGHSRGFIAGIYVLLEATIVNYFRISGASDDEHHPSWVALLKSLQTSYDKLEVMPFLRGQNFLSLHAYILYKMEKLANVGEKITFLQDLSQLLEHVKTNVATEPRMAIVWGAIISSGCKILSQSTNAEKPLLMLARHFHVLSTQTEGWGEGLLGVIGFKKDSISNRRKVLTRCISCIIFSLFPDTSSDTILPNQEFVRSFNEMKMLIANKKFNDVKMLIVKAIELIDDNKYTEVENVPGLIYRVIRLFYNDGFLETVPEVWSFEFKWP